MLVGILNGAVVGVLGGVMLGGVVLGGVVLGGVVLASGIVAAGGIPGEKPNIMLTAGLSIQYSYSNCSYYSEWQL